MKKLLIVEAVLFLAVTFLILTGFISLKTHNSDIQKGNKAYLESDYKEAKERYQSIENQGENQSAIKYNLGITNYQLEDYDEAAKQLLEAKNAYMALGNSLYRSGSIVEDPQQKIDIYEQSLEAYMNGMTEDSDNIEIKYNYEFVKKIVDELKEQQEQNNDQQDKEDQSQENDEQQDKEDQSQENDGQQGEDDQSQENDEQKDKEDQSQENDNNADDAQNNTETISEEEIDREAIEQILKMLEMQEEESLKNNQQVIEQGEGDSNDW